MPQSKTGAQQRRWFRNSSNELLARASLEKDLISGSRHTIYSLRHTAICMRIILSEGNVNIFNLAKNAGTSVDQIERFYARNLPLSKETVASLVGALVLARAVNDPKLSDDILRATKSRLNG